MNQQDVSRVPGRENYSLRYLQGGRIFSYAHQIDTVISFEPKSVLEVGAGGGVVTAALRGAGLEVTTLDVQAELEPDVVGSVTQIPCDHGSFDVSLCSQVLEHLPFDQFVPALRELRRVTKRGLVISLPDASPHYEVRLRLPRLRNFRWTGTRRRDPGPKWKEQKWERDGHYWEVGYTGTAVNEILGILTKEGFASPKTWRVPENPYHRFFSISLHSPR